MSILSNTFDCMNYEHLSNKKCVVSVTIKAGQYDPIWFYGWRPCTNVDIFSLIIGFGHLEMRATIVRFQAHLTIFFFVRIVSQLTPARLAFSFQSFRISFPHIFSMPVRIWCKRRTAQAYWTRYKLCSALFLFPFLFLFLFLFLLFTILYVIFLVQFIFFVFSYIYVYILFNTTTTTKNYIIWFDCIERNWTVSCCMPTNDHYKQNQKIVLTRKLNANFMLNSNSWNWKSVNNFSGSKY